MDHPQLRLFRDQIMEAAARRETVAIRGHASKAFLRPCPASAAMLDTRDYAGVADYEPTELVVTVRAGTPLALLEQTLAEQGQSLPFEPPAYADGCATIGGVVASGLSGPARPSAGAVRDYVLGMAFLNGKGEWLRTGGRVMKNVAGYDLGKILTGSWGTLALITEVSFKVLPRAPLEISLTFDVDQNGALARLAQWAAQPLPLNASCWRGAARRGTLHVRLRGAAAAVTAARQRMLASHGGQEVDTAEAHAFWHGLRHQHDAFFLTPARPLEQGARVLWRLSLPPTTPALDLPYDTLLEWHGGQRWYWAPADPATTSRLRQAAQAAGGSATPFRQTSNDTAALDLPHPRQPLDTAVQTLNRQIKLAFDPHGVFPPCPH